MPENEEMEKDQIPIVAVVQDLFFVAKITAAAKRVGVQVEFVRGERELIQKTEPSPSMVILDLNHSGLDAVDLITKLKADPVRKSHRIIGFVSHVQQDLIREAQKAGCDLVLPRSVFSQNLDELLRQRSCHL